MITYQEENWTDVVDEIHILAVDHWKEICAFDREKVVLKPNLVLYEAINKEKLLHVVTVRDSKELIGYYVSIITPHLHYSNTLVADNDIVFLKKEYRKGMTGYKLIKFAVEILKDKVQVIMLGMKVEHAFVNVMERLNFKLTEYKFTMETGYGC